MSYDVWHPINFQQQLLLRKINIIYIHIRLKNILKVSECDDIKMDTSTEHTADDETLVSESVETKDTVQTKVEANGDHS